MTVPPTDPVANGEKLAADGVGDEASNIVLTSGLSCYNLQPQNDIHILEFQKSR